MKLEEPRKILISGGWGYANLGDDAIVVSTVKLVRERYPNAEITVMTFNPEETRPLFKDNTVKVVKSIHRNLSDVSFERLGIAKSPKQFDPKAIEQYGLTERIGKAWSLKSANTVTYLKYKFFEIFPAAVSSAKYFKGMDLFIQAGGGYFIQSWRDSLYARVLELMNAHLLNIKILVIGQSIGPFSIPKFRSIAVKGLGCADVLSVRDVESFKELESYGLQPVLVPDTVLAQTDFAYKKRPVLAIILGSKRLKDSEMEIFHGALSEMQNKGEVEIRILVSRLWKPDLTNAIGLHERLKGHANVKIIIPESYSELQDQLGECEVLVSQNLHGLILAWRAGCACISINDKRKFISFMEQSGQSARLCPLKDLTKDRLKHLINDAFQEDRTKMEEIRHALSAKVRAEFNECLDKTWIA